jgi:hypothetical protein
MRTINLIDGNGFFLRSTKVQDGINHANSVSLSLPVGDLGVGKGWRWDGHQWEQADDPRLASVAESKIYTQAEWIRKNGFTGYKILNATKTDPLAQYFHEVLKAEDVVSMEDDRLAIAYGYYIGAGYITQEEADEICGFVVDPLTAEQVQQRITGG